MSGLVQVEVVIPHIEPSAAVSSSSLPPLRPSFPVPAPVGGRPVQGRQRAAAEVTRGDVVPQPQHAPPLDVLRDPQRERLRSVRKGTISTSEGRRTACREINFGSPPHVVVGPAPSRVTIVVVP